MNGNPETRVSKFQTVFYAIFFADFFAVRYFLEPPGAPGMAFFHP